MLKIIWSKIKKPVIWTVSVAVPVLVAILRYRNTTQIALEYERIKIENEIKEKEIRSRQTENRKECEKLTTELKTLKKKKENLIDRLKNLVTVVLIVCITYLPGRAIAQGSADYAVAYKQLQEDYLEAVRIAEEAIALAEKYEALAEKFEALYVSTDEELTRALEMNAELREWGEKLQQVLLKSMQKRFGVTGGVLYYQSNPGFFAGLSINF